MDLLKLKATLGLDSSEYNEGLNDAKSKATSIGGSIGNGLKTAAKVGAAAIGVATAAVGKFAMDSIQAGGEFDKSMSQVAATMGMTVEQLNATEEEMANMSDAERQAAISAQESFGKLRDFAQEMGSTTAFSASQAADALNYMALAGYNTEEAMQMLPNVLNLAAAGDMELARASDMVTDAQSALGLQMEDMEGFVDQLAKTASKSNTSVEQLGDAILTIGGTAKILSGGTTELNTSLGILADNGIKGAEGGTKLRNVLLSLSAPTDKASALLESLGVQAVDTATGNLKPLEEIMGDLSSSLDGLGSAEKAEIINTIFNKQDIAAVNALLDTSSDRWKELSADIEDSKGAAEAMAKTQLDNLAGDVTMFQSALEGAKIAVSDGLTPTLRQFVQFGTSGLSKITEAFKEGGLSGAMEAFGTILSDGLNMVIKMLPDMINAGMQLLGALGQGILDNLPIIIDAAVQIVVMLVQGLVQALPQLAQGVVTLITSLAQSLYENSGTLLESGKQLLTFIWEGIQNNLPTLLESGAEMVSNLVNGFLENFPSMIEAAGNLLTEVLGYLYENYPKFMETGLNLLLNIVNGIVNNLPQIIQAVMTVITQFIATITQNLPQILQQGITILGKLIAGLIQAIPQLIAAIPQIIKAIVDTFGSYNWLSIGINILEGIGQGILSAVGSVVDAAVSAAGQIWDSITGFFSISSPSKKMIWAGQMIDKGFAKGIDDNIDLVEDAIDNLTEVPSIDVNASGKNTNPLNNVIINVYGTSDMDEMKLARIVANEVRDQVISIGATA